MMRIWWKKRITLLNQNQEIRELADNLNFLFFSYLLVGLWSHFKQKYSIVLILEECEKAAKNQFGPEQNKWVHHYYFICIYLTLKKDICFSKTCKGKHCCLTIGCSLQSAKLTLYFQHSVSIQLIMVCSPQSCLKVHIDTDCTSWSMNISWQSRPFKVFLRPDGLWLHNYY